MGKIAALAAAAAAVTATIAGATPASAGIWATYNLGAYADQQYCDSVSDGLWDPPYWYSYDCHYYASDPDNRGRGAGWYFWNRVDIR
ncbi:hypothetical protein V5P93_003715 [Actinokineospora auranticolor]|uniref:Uncharacterized protein n=1 Tax=Actinokineospora auranticolor TaxID=155976 RepID=A0A2S6GJ82_9PSEU|nr:hypothetical protein [Actinokineospora auranticolor]PPK65277.1 hypothetical protein CLV40_115124 [Actinokineospora auranticolor]